jgi:hypothetical protein
MVWKISAFGLVNNGKGDGREAHWLIIIKIFD